MKKFDVSNIAVSKIIDVCSYTLPVRTEGDAVASHSLIIVKHKGKTEYEVSGKKYVADSENIVFIPAGTSYSMYVYRSGECTVIEFDGECPEAEISEFYTGSDKEIMSSVKSLLHFWKLKGPAYHSKCLSELYSVITQLSTLNSYAYSLAGKYRLIHKSVKYIESNYKKIDLYTPDLAKMSGMGETYYRSIFISVFNVPPAKYIQNYRVEKAKELLVNSAGAIEDIAVAVGFANSSYFCKVFKSTTGLTPTEYAAKGKRIG